MTWRMICDDGVGASAGLAADEALMGAYAHGEPECSPTLRLYTYASHCALVGRYQDVSAEVDLDACERSGTPVDRRPTGGGAIIMGSDQLGVAVVDRVRPAERPKETIERFAQGIVQGLATLGIDAEFRGKNDLEVAGRKIAGLGLYLDGNGGLLFHSSVLASLDIPFMLDVLQIPAAKLGDKAVGAVQERVTTVSRETGERWTGSGLRDAIARGFEQAFDRRAVPGSPTSDERSAAEVLEATKYGTSDWVFQRTLREDGRGTAALKTPAGFIRVYVAVSGGAIKNVMFTGDFNEFPDALVRLESALKWTRLERVDEVVEGDWAGDLGVPPATVADAVREAGERAFERTGAPVREGSCYFPEVG